MFIFIFLVNSWFVFVVSYLFTTSADCLVHVAFMFVWLAKPPLNRGTEVPHDVQSNTNVRNIKLYKMQVSIYTKSVCYALAPSATWAAVFHWKMSFKPVGGSFTIRNI